MLGSGETFGTPTQVEADGVSFLLHTISGSDLSAVQMANGAFEAPLPTIFHRTVKRWPGLVLDVGANSGIYSVLACLADPSVIVRAFEPYPPAVKVLRRNIAANGLRKRIKIKKVALSDKTGEAPLYVPDTSHGALETSSSLREDFRTFASSFVVKVKALDDVKLRAPPSVLKVDIEGHELAFLRGAERTIRKAQPIIFVEILHVAPFQELDELRNRLGYVDVRLQPDRAVQSARVAFDPLAWNHAFVPPAKLGAFTELVTGAGLVPVIESLQ